MSSEDSNYSSQGERVRSNTVTLSPLSCNDLFWSKQYVLAFFIKIRFSPAQEVKEEEIQTVLQNYLLPDSKDALKERISQLQVQGRVLQLTINTFPDEKNTCSKFMMI